MRWTLWGNRNASYVVSKMFADPPTEWVKTRHGGHLASRDGASVFRKQCFDWSRTGLERKMNGSMSDLSSQSEQGTHDTGYRMRASEWRIVDGECGFRNDDLRVATLPFLALNVARAR